MLIPFILSAQPIDERDVAHILDRLDRELVLADTYIGSRISNIDSMKARLADESMPIGERLDLIFGLGESYNVYRVDSALHYYAQGYELSSQSGLDSVASRFAIKRATFLPLLLYISKAQEIMDSVSLVALPDGLKPEYFDAQRQMNNYISNFFVDYPDTYDLYRGREYEMQKELLGVIDKGSPRYKLNLAEHKYYSGELVGARSVLVGLLNEIDELNPLYARACHMMSDIAKAVDDRNGHVYYLALSAISDTRCATLEVSSLQELGQLLYKRNDVKRAHDYLSRALSNAVDCRVSLRMIQSAQVLPIIETAHKAQIKSFRKRIFIVIGILGLLLIALFVTLRLVYKNNLIQHRMSRRLEEANKAKDVYITQFLNLCSSYMDKLNQFNKMVNRKITAGKCEDLLKLTKSGKFVEEQSKEFYEIFDDAFLHIYPTFVSDVNRLLQPDRQLVMRDGEKLNTDLRILALMRLGIEDTSRIAQMLNYSVFTIYTYRNKFKSRAIDRDTFESSVMKIKSIS